MSEQFNAFLENQNTIYDKFRATSAEIGHSIGIEKDPGADPQGAFLVAWRYPEKTTSLVEEFSLEAANLIDAIAYGGENAHTTVSDHGLHPNLTIELAYPEHAEILDTLTNAVRRALDVSGTDRINACGVEFKDTPTNGKTIIAAGIPTESVWQINEQIKTESTELGISLKGTWGTHMTINRFLEDKPANSPAVSALMKLIHETPSIGPSIPEAIDVGYFQIDPQNGFVFTPYERFELGKS
jgi:hypothetical protein